MLSIGKTSTQFLQVGRDEYLKRLKHYTRLEWVEIADPKHANKLNPKQLKEAEGRLLLQHFDKTEHVVLLDENGKQFNSRGFSEQLNKWMLSGNRRLNLVIGGPYGFSEEIYQRATGKISLSQMTFSHQLVRIVLLEQLYRAFTILRGEKYHHD